MREDIVEVMTGDVIDSTEIEGGGQEMTRLEKQGGGEKMTRPPEAAAPDTSSIGLPKRKRGRPKMTAEERAMGKTKRLANIAASPDPGDNTLYVRKNLELFRLGKVDLYDPKALLDRTNKYFQIMARYDSKPTLSGYAMAIGIDRRRIWEIKTGNFPSWEKQYRDLPEASVIIIRKMYDYLEMMWEDYMLNGKINPVTGIFIAKNQFGYQDRIDYVPSAAPEQEKYDAESIRKRYQDLADDEK